MVDNIELFLGIQCIRKNEKKKPKNNNIYQQLQKDEKHIELVYETFPLRKKCPYSELFWSRFTDSDWIRRNTEYLSVFSPNAEKCEKNTDQNNSEYGQFLRSFDQLIENFLVSGPIFTKTDPDSFHFSNDNIITESFHDIILLWLDSNEKENKIRDLNHGFEILLGVSEFKLNDINSQITCIHTALKHIKLKMVALGSVRIRTLTK